MREILFRGKRVDNGEEVEGFYVNVPEHYKQKQIEEMAKEMCKEYGTYICKNECQLCGDCANEYIAENLIAAGYRKQSDTVREILQKLIYNITANNTNDGYLSESIDYSSTIDDIKELAARYGVEVKE